MENSSEPLGETPPVCCLAVCIGLDGLLPPASVCQQLAYDASAPHLIRLRLNAQSSLIDMKTLVNMQVVRVVIVQVAVLCYGRAIVNATLAPHEPHKRLARLRQVVVKKVTTQVAEPAADLRVILADLAIQGRHT